jgi:hypothetical protein
MSKRLLKYRIGAGPAFTYQWLLDTDPVPAGVNAVVDSVDENKQEIKHDSGSNAHYWMEGISFSAPDPAGTITIKNVYTVPDLTRGIDLMGALIYSGTGKTGDRITYAAVLFGQIAAVIAADAGAKTVTLRGPIGIMRATSKGGRIDEGFYLSFGTEAFVEANALEEFMIRRIGDPTPVGDNVNEDVVMTLDTFPGATPTGGTAANLVVKFVRNPLELTGSEPIKMGEETFNGSPIAAGKVVRVAYERNGTGSTKVRGHLAVLY